MTDYAKTLYEMDHSERMMHIPILNAAEREVLHQLMIKPRWDGYVASKSARDSLCHMGLASYWNGMNFLTQSGWAVADALWRSELEKVHK